ncbi:MAG: cold shock domain-containing protein [Saprospiraceae bacterium]|nr:cold shock domain-containing protein [Saprospiraceae bacterium]
MLGVPSRSEDPADAFRSGTIKFFNQEKGYGFVIDSETKESLFVHINDLNGPVKENDKVNFEIEHGQKGPKAVRVKLG